MNFFLRNVSIQTLSIGVCFFLLFISPTHAQKDPIPNPKLKSSSNTILPNSDDQKVPNLDQKQKLGSPIGAPIGSPMASPKPSIDDEKDHSIDPKLKSSSNSKSPKSPIYEQMDPIILDVKPKANSNTILAKPPSQDQKDHTPHPKSKSSSNASSPKSPTDDHKTPTLDPKSKPNSNATSPKSPTDAHKNPALDKSKPNSNTTSPEPPTNTHKNPTPDSKTKPKNSTSSKPKPNRNPTPPPTKPNPNPTPSQTKPNATSPYHVANNFCLSRRLDVRNTFCLMVLRSSPNSTKAKDNQALLDIAADSALKFGNKTILFLKNLSKDKKTKPDLKPVIDECLSAYDGFITQYNRLVEEARTEAHEMPSYDAELAKLEISRCVKALNKSKNGDIAAQNKVALDYTKLAQNIADSIKQ